MSIDDLALTLRFADEAIQLRCREFAGEECLGTAGALQLTLLSQQPLQASALVGKPCALSIDLPHSPRLLAGTVMRLTKLATTMDQQGEYSYRLLVRSTFAMLALNQQTRVFQHLSAPDIVKEVLIAAGWPEDAIGLRLAETYPAIEYCVQYAESDATFIRRICEEAGIYFRFAPGENHELFSLEDSSGEVEPTLAESLKLAATNHSRPEGLMASELMVSRKRRAGKVTVRDYDRKQPALELEAEQTDGTAVEQGTEVYVAPADFRTQADGKRRAKQRLLALRARAKEITFSSNAYALAPGDAFDLEAPPEHTGLRADGRFLVVALEHSWRGTEQRLTVRAIPIETPFLLARKTPTPCIHGVHTAIVSDAADSEIHPDQDGCVFLRFHWDRFGPKEGESSLPVRVAQPNMPGSMAIPRVGWEVAVAFEDGDPDRPYVLGRLYNAEQTPPFPLPANKTVTSFCSYSSPGGGGRNSIHFDDAAGRQHVLINAQFGLNTTVSNNRFVQTANVETHNVGGDHTISVGGDESLSVTEAHIVGVGSQSATVGAQQSIGVAGDLSVSVGDEGVVIGGALLEKVGNPVQGAVNLGVSAVLAGAGVLGERFGPVGQALTKVATTAGGIAWGMYQAATAPGAGPNAARDAGIRGLMGAAAQTVPGGDALFNSASSMGMTFPWEPPPPDAGGAAAGGGAGGARGDSAAAKGPGPGHRNTKVSGAMAEGIGGGHAVLTPGEIKWQGSGAALVGVSGSHSTKAVRVGYGILGASLDTLGSFHIKTDAEVVRQSSATVTTNVSGSLKAKASGTISISSGAALDLKVGGSLTLKGSHVSFNVGSSSVSASPGGVLIKSSQIKITGTSKQSKHTAH